MAFELNAQDIKDYRSGMPTKVLAADHGVSVRTVQRALQCHLGVRTQGAQRVYTLRHDAFSHLSEEGRYWVGSLLADGSVCGKVLNTGSGI